jgi:hypothetical protein
MLLIKIINTTLCNIVLALQRKFILSASTIQKLMNKKYLHSIFVVIFLLLFSSLLQTVIQRFNKFNTSEVSYSISKNNVVKGVVLADCLIEMEEDFSEDSPESFVEIFATISFDFLNIKSNSLLAKYSKHIQFNKNIFNNVPIHLSIRLLRI